MIDQTIAWGGVSSDPHTEFWVCWIDTESGGNNQTISWGEQDLDNSRSVEPDALEGSDAYVYQAKLTGLSALTEYNVEIEGTDFKTYSFETLPTDPISESLTFAAISDIHPWRDGGENYMYGVDPGGATMSSIASQNPDLLLIPGDWPVTDLWCVDCGRDVDETIIDFFQTYQTELNGDGRLIPKFMSVGNHEWGGSSWDPYTEEPSPVGDRDGEYFELLFPNMFEMADEDHGEQFGYNAETTIGDSVQLIAMDAMRNKPESNADWLEGVIRDDVDTVIPMHHMGFWQTRDDPTNQNHSQANRSEYLPIIYDDDGYKRYPVHIALTGHDHTRGVSHPFYYSPNPDGNENVELDDEGYACVEPGSDGYRTIREYAAGWPTFRTVRDDGWMFEQLSDGDYEQHYIIDIGNPSISIEEIDMSDNVQTEHTFRIIDVNPTVSAGKTLIVQADITNDGQRGGSETVSLLKEGDKLDSVTIDLTSGETEAIQLEWVADETGRFEISIDSGDDTETMMIDVV